MKQSLWFSALCALSGIVLGTTLVSAATTISTDIQTDGALSVTGTTALMGNVGIGTTSPADNLVVSNPTSTASFSIRSAGASVGAGNVRFAMQNGDGNIYQWQYAGSGNTVLRLQYNASTKDVISSTGQISLGTLAATPLNMLNVNGSAAIGSTYYAATAPTNGLLVQGNVGIGTSTPATQLQVSSGASATTTVTIGELGLSSSKACVNMNQANGSPGSFYIANGVFVVENNYCR